MRILLTNALFIFLLSSSITGFSGQRTKEVYALLRNDAGDVKLAAEFNVRRYATKISIALLADSDVDGHGIYRDSSFGLVKSYIRNIVRGASSARLKKYYYVDHMRWTDPVFSDQDVNDWRKFLNKYVRMDIESEWFFGDLSELVVSLVSADGHKDPWSFEIYHSDEGVFLVDGFSESGHILDTFWFVMNDWQSRTIDKSDIHSLSEHIVILPVDNITEGKNSDDLTIYKHDSCYEGPQVWGALNGSVKRKNSSLIGYLYKAYGILEKGDVDKSLALWFGEERNQNRRLTIDSIDSYSNKLETIKRRLSGEIMHLCTTDIDPYYIHYYMKRSEPKKVFFIVISKNNGDYYLTDKLSMNITSILSDHIVLNGVFEEWRKRSKVVFQ